MPACIQELHAKGLALPGADRRRGDQPRVQLPRALPRRQRLRRGLRARRLLLQGRLRGPGGDGPADRRRTPAARSWRSCAPARPSSARRATRPSRRSTSPMTPCARPRAPTCRSPRRRSGACRRSPVDLDEVYRHLDTHVLFKLHWGGRGVKGEAWQKLLREDFRPRLERMWREQAYLHPRALLGFFPCYSLGNDIVVLDPEDRETELTRFVCPRQPKGDRICLADFFRPAIDGAAAGRARRDRGAGGDGRRRGDRADGQARGRRRVRRAAVRPRPRRADGRGPGRVAALARARDARDRRRPRAGATRGATRRCPSSQST